MARRLTTSTPIGRTTRRRARKVRSDGASSQSIRSQFDPAPIFGERAHPDKTRLGS